MQTTRFVLPIMMCSLLLGIVLAGVASLIGHGLPRSDELAYAYLRSIDDWDVSLMDIERGVHIPIVISPFIDGWPSWSPDGQRMVFGYDPLTIYGNDDGNLNALVFARTLNVNGMYPSWSPDGSQIAFTEFDGYNHLQIYTVSVDGNNIRQITVAEGWHSSWSPDSSQLVYTCPIRASSQICIVSVDGGDPQNLTQSRVEGNFASWSPDGRQILFACSTSIASSYLCVMDINGDNLRVMDYAYDRVSRPTWSPDGSHIAFAHAGTLYVMNADGSNLRALTNGEREYDSPAWRP